MPFTYILNWVNSTKRNLNSVTGFVLKRFKNSKQWSIALLLLLTLFGFWFGGVLYKKYQSGSVDLVVDMEASGGGYCEVYINNDYEQVHSLLILSGKRALYRFPGIPSVIRHLRIDPVDDVGEDIRIYRISFMRGDEELLRIPGTAVKNWGMLNIKMLESVDNCSHFKSLTRDPIIMHEAEYVFNEGFQKAVTFFHGPVWVSRVLESVFTPSKMFIVVSFFIVLVLIITGIQRSFCLLGGPFFMFFIILLLGNKVIVFFLNRYGTAPSIQQAVGYASYIGYSKSLEVQAFLILTFLALFVGAVFFLFMRKWGSKIPGVSTLNVPLPHRSGSMPFLFIVLGMFAILSLPSLNAASVALKTVKHVAQWDSLNLLTWQYEMQMGWLPYKDFWFPYGGFAYFCNPFPYICFVTFCSSLLFLVHS